MSEFEKIVAIIDRFKKNGFKVSKNGAKLIGHVPHIAPLAYMHKLYPALTKDEVRRLRGKLNVEVPSVYGEFLQLTNGISLFSGNLALYGFIEHFYRDVDRPQPFDLLTPNSVERANDAAPSFCFVGSYRQDGSKLYIDNDTLNVYRCNGCSSRPLNKWWDFWDMLYTEVTRLDALFDENGKVINVAALLPKENI